MKLSTTLALLLLSLGCDEAASEAPAIAPGSAPAIAPGAAPSEAPGEAPTAQACSLSISVTGAETFEDEVNFNVARVERGDDTWLSLMAMATSNQPGYILNMFVRVDAAGSVPFDEPGMNKLNINFIAGEDYGADETGGAEAGAMVVTQGPEGWLSAEGNALLSNSDGTSIQVAVNLTTAIPPLRCPRN